MQWLGRRVSVEFINHAVITTLELSFLVYAVWIKIRCCHKTTEAALSYSLAPSFLFTVPLLK